MPQKSIHGLYCIRVRVVVFTCTTAFTLFFAASRKSTTAGAADSEVRRGGVGRVEAGALHVTGMKELAGAPSLDLERPNKPNIMKQPKRAPASEDRMIFMGI